MDLSIYFDLKNSCSDILGYGHIQTHSKHEKCCNIRIFIDLSEYINHQVTGNICVSAVLPSDKRKLSFKVFSKGSEEFFYKTFMNAYTFG